MAIICRDDLAAMPQPLIQSNVPGRAAIDLVAYYEEFAWYYPNCEPETKYWFVRNAKPDWVIFDVGANVGYYATLFSQLAPQGRVYAFEPTATWEMLKANLAHNGCDNVEALQIALGERTGQVEDGIFRMWGEKPEERVYPFYRLDDYVAERGITRLDCIKIDVDSFDFEVLKGARETILKLKPIIVVELNHALSRRNQSNIKALEWLRDLGVTTALSLDGDNFVCGVGYDAQASFAAKSRMDIVFADTSVVPGPSEEESVEVIETVNVPHQARPHAGELTAIKDGDQEWPTAIEVVTQGAQWTYAADLPWTLDLDPDAGLRFAIDIEVLSGQVGAVCLSRENSFLGPERVVGVGRRRTILLRVSQPRQLQQILFRNQSETGEATRFRVFGVSLVRLDRPAVAPQGALPIRELAERLKEAEAGDGGDWTAASDGALQVTPLADLGAVLGFDVPTGEREQPGATSLVDWKMERDDAPIFRYIYRHHQPKRHLEFGTWQGFGVVACAESCDAEIWTLNLPEGEKTEAGLPLYGERGGEHIEATDTGDFIGRLYREAGYGDRVHQILADSVEWRPDMAPGFFDSALIDGGHTYEVVTSDTDKTIALTRPGAIVMWHDFCPDEEALQAHTAPRGVVEALVRNHHRWAPHFSQLFWVRPSWVLVGVRR